MNACWARFTHDSEWIRPPHSRGGNGAADTRFAPDRRAGAPLADIVAAITPPPAVAVAAPVDEEVYVPAPNDVHIAAVVTTQSSGREARAEQGR